MFATSRRSAGQPGLEEAAAGSYAALREVRAALIRGRPGKPRGTGAVGPETDPPPPLRKPTLYGTLTDRAASNVSDLAP